MPILSINHNQPITSNNATNKYLKAKELGLPLLNEEILISIINDTRPSYHDEMIFKQWLRIEHDGNSINCIHDNPLLCQCLLSKEYRLVDIGMVMDLCNLDCGVWSLI